MTNSAKFQLAVCQASYQSQRRCAPSSRCSPNRPGGRAPHHSQLSFTIFFFPAPWRAKSRQARGTVASNRRDPLHPHRLTRAQPRAPGIDRPALWHRPIVAGDALAFYIGKLLVPLRLNIDYGRSPAFVLASTSTFVAWVVPLACVLFAIVKRRHAWFIAGVLIFLLAPLRVLGLRPFDFQHFSTVADRYVYLAMLGPAIILAGIAQRSSRSALMAMAIPLLLIIPTELQIRVWKNDQTLLTRAIALNPRSVAANRTLGYLAAAKGQFRRSRRPLSKAR